MPKGKSMETHRPIVVDVNLGFADLYKATLRMSVYALRYLLGAIVLLVVLYAICFVVATAQISSSANADALGQWLFPLLIGAVPTVIIMIPLVAFVRVKMLLRTEGADGKRRYTFTDAEIRIESRLANAEVKWPAFRQVRESKNYFLLYIAMGLANVLPKRFFSDQASVEEFRSLVRAHVRKVKLRNGL
jgi:YcxB-like protein